MSNSDQLLKNKNIVLTRSPEQITESSMIFEKLGARVILFPTIKIIPPKSWDDFDSSLNQLSTFDYLIFTSPNAVKMFSKRCLELKIEPDFTSIKVASVGKKTSSLCAENNIPVHITPYKFTGKELARKLKGVNLEGKRFLIPRSAIGREDLLGELKEAGAVIVTAVVYDVGITSKEEVKDYIEELSKQQPDAFLFTSPSTFDNFVKIMDLTNPAEYFAGITVAAIGPTTKTVIEKNNVKVDVMPEEHTMESLAEALVKHFAAK
jgi:uroporphyrinogen-III synthase